VAVFLSCSCYGVFSLLWRGAHSATRSKNAKTGQRRQSNSRPESTVSGHMEEMHGGTLFFYDLSLQGSITVHALYDDMMTTRSLDCHCVDCGDRYSLDALNTHSCICLHIQFTRAINRKAQASARAPSKRNKVFYTLTFFLFCYDVMNVSSATHVSRSQSLSLSSLLLSVSPSLRLSLHY
jgi:hypothetical protein